MKLKFPGKLYIMGEYAVVIPGHPSVVAAINRYIHVTINPAKNLKVESSFGTIHELQDETFKGPMRYVAYALQTAFEYAGKEDSFTMLIESELDDVSNKKYGFGSSGVVIVSVIASVLSHYEVSYTQEELFKLSVLTQARMNELSSGGDLAASIYGGVISYSRYDKDWLMKQELAVDLIKLDWPMLVIQKLPWNDFEMVVGWTQSENKTNPYVSTFLEWGHNNPVKYTKFLENAQNITHGFIEGVKKTNRDSMADFMSQYRYLLNQLALDTGLNIETKTLEKLVAIANKYDLMAKLSGSGGGDCGIAIGQKIKNEIIEKIDIEWQKSGILLLDVEVTNNEYSF